MDNSLTPEKQNMLIEESLHTYPVATIPRDITADVMLHIETLPAPRPFRLTWSDLALSIILSLCIGAVWFGLNNLPPLVIAQIRKESILLYQHIVVNSRWLFPVFAFCLAALLSALTIPFLKAEMARESSNSHLG